MARGGAVRSLPLLLLAVLLGAAAAAAPTVGRQDVSQACTSETNSFNSIVKKSDCLPNDSYNVRRCCLQGGVDDVQNAAQGFFDACPKQVWPALYSLFIRNVTNNCAFCEQKLSALSTAATESGCTAQNFSHAKCCSSYGLTGVSKAAGYYFPVCPDPVLLGAYRYFTNQVKDTCSNNAPPPTWTEAPKPTPPSASPSASSSPSASPSASPSSSTAPLPPPSSGGSGCDLVKIGNCWQKELGAECANQLSAQCCGQVNGLVKCLQPLVKGCSAFEYDEEIARLQKQYKNCQKGSFGAAVVQDDGGDCFPGGALVTRDDGALVPMHRLRVGERVLVAGGKYSDVFAFGHRTPEREREFLQLTTRGGAVLELSARHYVSVDGGASLRAAAAVALGDTLQLADGSTDAVSAIRRVRRRGQFNPHTLDGSIVVNGVLASTYTQWVHPALAHRLLAPLRAAYKLGVRDPLRGALDRSPPAALHQWMPRGPATVPATAG